MDSSVNFIYKIGKEYADYLKDESRKIGKADTISFPETEEEVRQILSLMYSYKTPVTIQGARTGVTAGASPIEGHILNLCRMNRIIGLRYDEKKNSFFLIVQPGVLLSQINNTLASMDFDTLCWSEESISTLYNMKKSGRFLFPPDPTEASASIGGMVACNASGACSFYYGSIRKYIEALNIALSDGSYIYLRRGEYKVNGRSFSIPSSHGKIYHGMVPSYVMPNVKNASGYYAEDNMDFIDLFIGCEGTLGAVTQIELRLIEMPHYKKGMTTFFPSEKQSLEFIQEIRNEGMKVAGVSNSANLVAVEFFNYKSLELMRGFIKDNPAFLQISCILPEFHTAVYIEYHGNDEDEVDNRLIDAATLLVKYGGNEDSTWVAMDFKEMERLKAFRHTVPEAVNMLIDQRRRYEPKLTKLGTDMAVPDDELFKVMEMYNRDIETAGLESVIFGHIGNSHVHVNILPRNMDEYRAGKQLYTEWGHIISAMGGTISAEHGVGKLKTDLLTDMFGTEGIEQMLAVKQIFDVDFILNRGNLFNYGDSSQKVKVKN